MEYDDRNNVHKPPAVKVGELVRAEDYPEFDAPVIDDGKNAGVTNRRWWSGFSQNT